MARKNTTLTPDQRQRLLEHFRHAPDVHPREDPTRVTLAATAAQIVVDAADLIGSPWALMSTLQSLEPGSDDAPHAAAATATANNEHTESAPAAYAGWWAAWDRLLATDTAHKKLGMRHELVVRHSQDAFLFDGETIDICPGFVAKYPAAKPGEKSAMVTQFGNLRARDAAFVAALLALPAPKSPVETDRS